MRGLCPKQSSAVAATGCYRGAMFFWIASPSARNDGKLLDAMSAVRNDVNFWIASPSARNDVQLMDATSAVRNDV